MNASKNENGPAAVVEQLLSAKKTLQGRLTRMQKALKSWEDLGGLERAIRKTEIVRDGLDEFREVVEASIPRLEGAVEPRRLEHQGQLYQSLQQYAEEHDLRFEGTPPQSPHESSTVRLGDYRVVLEPGEEAQVHFAKEHVGTLRSADPDALAASFGNLRDNVEVETEDFLIRLKAAYDAVGGRRGGNVELGRVLQRFVIDLQPDKFWESAEPQNLRRYGHANFAWEVLREDRKGTLPFQVSEASVHANVAAAGRGGNKGTAVYLLLRSADRPRLYAHIVWRASSEADS